MKKFVSIICSLIIAIAAAKAQDDPAKVDPAHYKVIFDNPRVRILDVHLKPGEKTPMHSHPDLIAYFLTGGTVKSTLPDGKTTIATTKAGEVIWHNAQTHSSENIGDTEIHSLGIELKK